MTAPEPDQHDDDRREERSATTRRIERQKRGPRPSWRTHKPWTTATAAELAAMPVGTRRALTLAPGFYASVTKTGPGAWRLSRRYDLPDELLTLIPTAPRERKDDGPTPDESKPGLTSFADAVALMLPGREAART